MLILPNINISIRDRKEDVYLRLNGQKKSSHYAAITAILDSKGRVFVLIPVLYFKLHIWQDLSRNETVGQKMALFLRRSILLGLWFTNYTINLKLFKVTWKGQILTFLVVCYL